MDYYIFNLWIFNVSVVIFILVEFLAIMQVIFFQTYGGGM